MRIIVHMLNRLVSKGFSHVKCLEYFSRVSQWLDIVLASDGEEERQRTFIERKELSDFPFVLSTELGMTYQVAKLPFAVLLDAKGVLRAKGLTNNREHLESLFEAMEQGVASIQEFMSKRQQGVA